MVLLVDDNEATTTLLTALLHREFEIDVAADGVDAVERLKTRNYGAVILDLLMPQLDGYGVLDFVSENKPEMLRSIIVVSAALTRKEMSRIRQYKICDVISKPFEVDHLLSTIRKCVDPSAGPRGTLISSGVILLLAEVLRRKWM